jgi:Uma2 family endonuclease
MQAIQHLPDGATLVLHGFDWDDYERLLEDLAERPHLRVSYDRGRLEIMSPRPEHEEYARFIEGLVRVLSEELRLNVQSYGSATWRRQKVARGAEPDGCYYVANAARVIGKREFDLDVDPPPDIVVEIDLTNESLSKSSIYAALAVAEIWRYENGSFHFYQLAGGEYAEISESLSFHGLGPAMLAEALQESRTHGQTNALAAFRKRWQAIAS